MASTAGNAGSAGVAGKPKKKGVSLGVKIMLDVVMALVLVLLYKAKVLTLTFHEVAGLAILLVFALHVAFNWNWVVSVGKKLFSKSTPARTRFSYWMTILLVISFLMIILSGLFISKVLFKDVFDVDGPWKSIHYFFSAVALVLVGIHLGLYWDKAKAVFGKKIKIAGKAGKVVAYVLLACVLGFGCYSMATTNFGKWLTFQNTKGGHGITVYDVDGNALGMTRQITTEPTGEEGEVEAYENGQLKGYAVIMEAGKGGEDHFVSERVYDAEGNLVGLGDIMSENPGGDDVIVAYDESGNEAGYAMKSELVAPTENAGADESATDEDAADESATEEGAAESGEQAEGERRGGGDGDQRGGGDAGQSGESEGQQSGEGEGAQSGHGGHGQEPITAGSILLTIARFGSILGAFSIATYYVDRFIKRRSRAKKAAGAK